jgi:glucose-1-phosphate cytidylyltransferase
MKVILLAGGFGTRLSEYTENIPKPMVRIGNKPILMHIMDIYSFFGHTDFFIALGYKAEVIKEYFLNYYSLNSDFKIDLNNGNILNYNHNELNRNVSLIDTGLSTMTGGRLKRLKNYIGNETFMLTYGDGVSNINLDDLLKFHKSHGKLVTMSAVRPNARFGELILDDNKVVNFQEKPQLDGGWVNGGFFIIEPQFFDYISGDETFLEREPLEKVANEGQLMAYKHTGFWQCMDSKRDLELLESIWSQGSAPWIFNN